MQREEEVECKWMHRLDVPEAMLSSRGSWCAGQGAGDGVKLPSASISALPGIFYTPHRDVNAPTSMLTSAGRESEHMEDGTCLSMGDRETKHDTPIQAAESGTGGATASPLQVHVKEAELGDTNAGHVVQQPFRLHKVSNER